MSTILEFPKHVSGMSPEEALDTAAKENFSEMLIVGYNRDDDLVIMGSRLTKRDALWLIEVARLHVLGT